MRETIVVYCDDCPILRLCRDEGRDCDWTRWVHKAVSEAPPLTPTQIRKLTALLGRATPRPEKPAKRDHNKHRQAGPFQCQVPGCDGTPLKHTGSLWQHVQLVHEITYDEYKDRYGEPVPLTTEELAAIVVEVSCEVCGQVYSTELGHRWPRGALNSHLRGRHGLKPDYTPIRTETR